MHIRNAISQELDGDVSTDNYGKTPLFEAIKNGHDGAAAQLAEAGASLSIDNPGIRLCEAVAAKELGFLRGLLANGMNPNSKNYNLQTPLHLAAAEGLFQVCVLLLQTGASVFAMDRYSPMLIDSFRLVFHFINTYVVIDVDGAELRWTRPE